MNTNSERKQILISTLVVIAISIAQVTVSLFVFKGCGRFRIMMPSNIYMNLPSSIRI